MKLLAILVTSLALTSCGILTGTVEINPDGSVDIVGTVTPEK